MIFEESNFKDRLYSCDSISSSAKESENWFNTRSQKAMVYFNSTGVYNEERKKGGAIGRE